MVLKVLKTDIWWLNSSIGKSWKSFASLCTSSHTNTIRGGPKPYFPGAQSQSSCQSPMQWRAIKVKTPLNTLQADDNLDKTIICCSQTSVDKYVWLQHKTITDNRRPCTGQIYGWVGGGLVDYRDRPSDGGDGDPGSSILLLMLGCIQESAGSGECLSVTRCHQDGPSWDQSHESNKFTMTHILTF